MKKIILILLSVSLLVSAKETSDHLLVTTKQDFWVGWFGGTGCKRHWDVLDFEDASHHQPFERCGKYVMVSRAYNKWVNFEDYKDTKSKFLAYPIKGDVFLAKAQCLSNQAANTYKVVQYENCGDSGKTIAFCDELGNAITEYNCQ